MFTVSHQRPMRLVTLNKHSVNRCDGDGIDFVDCRRRQRIFTPPLPPRMPAELYFRTADPMESRRHVNQRRIHGIDNLLRNANIVEEMAMDAQSNIGPVVTSFGTICVFLEHQIRVDITIDQAVRIVNPMANCVAAINARGSVASLIHPYGRVYQNGSQVDVRTPRKQRAKMSHRGITFAAAGSPVVYLLDDGGARTTVESFINLDDDNDFSLEVFYGGGRYGEDVVDECLEAVAAAEHNGRRNNDWHINGVDVTQDTRTGDVYLSRDQGRRQMKTSPIRGNVSMTTPYIHACASSPPEAHVFVRRGERRIHASELCFNARNGSHSVGFDDAGKFTVY